MRPLGVVVSRRPPTHLRFEFELAEPGAVAPGDYVEVPFEGGAIVARVYSVRVENPYMAEPGVASEHARLGLRLPSRSVLEQTEVHVAAAEVVGVVSPEGEVGPPHVPPAPGSEVYRAAPGSLRAVLGLAEEGVRLGSAWRLGVDVVLDPEFLAWHHVAVLGATGSGKSHTLAVLAEELSGLGLAVVIVDPHGEYRGLAEALGGYSVRADRVLVEPDLVPPDAIADATDMTGVQRDLLYLAYEEAEGPGLDALEEAVARVAARYRFHRETVLGVVRRLATLRRMGVFAGRGLPLSLEEGAVVAVDAGVGLGDRVSSALVGAIARAVFEYRRAGDAPPLVLMVDEAHRFLPQDEDPYSKAALRLIAREGRKFKAGLAVASQRVVGLDKDVLSQCGTKIVLRMDSPTDIAMLRPLLGPHADTLPALPTGMALIAGVAVRHPILVKVRERRIREGSVSRLAAAEKSA